MIQRIRKALAGAFMWAALLLAVLLSGCASAPRYITVPCRAPAVAKPAFPFDALQPGSDSFTQTKTLLADRDVRKGYEGQLEAAVGACQ